MAKEAKRKKLSLSSQILIGMGLGIAAGVFFGEYCGFLQKKRLQRFQTHHIAQEAERRLSAQGDRSPGNRDSGPQRQCVNRQPGK